MLSDGAHSRVPGRSKIPVWGWPLLWCSAWPPAAWWGRSGAGSRVWCTACGPSGSRAHSPEVTSLSGWPLQGLRWAGAGHIGEGLAKGEPHRGLRTRTSCLITAVGLDPEDKGSHTVREWTGGAGLAAGYQSEPASHHPNLQSFGRIRARAEQMEGCKERQSRGLRD